MAVYDYNALLAQAEEEGVSTHDLPVGRYNAEVTHVNVGETKAGQPRVGLRWKAVDGPDAGGSRWQNINWPALGPDGKASNPKALGPWIGNLRSVGFDPATVGEAPSLEALFSTVIGQRQVIDVTSRENGGTTYFDVRPKGLLNPEPSVAERVGPLPEAEPERAVLPSEGAGPVARRF